MAEQTMRDELHDAKRHAKDAARATLMAMRNVVDFALSKLDGDDAPKGDPAGRMTPTGTPDESAPPPRDV